MSETAPLRVGQTLIGPLFNEPMRVETVSAAGNSSLVVGLVGAQSERFRRATMSESDLAILEAISLAGNAEDVRAEIVELKQLAMQAKAAETRSRNGDAARINNWLRPRFQSRLGMACRERAMKTKQRQRKDGRPDKKILAEIVQRVVEAAVRWDQTATLI
jgi:hypothetical protein